jgi:hypothetical protein
VVVSYLGTNGTGTAAGHRSSEYRNGYQLAAWQGVINGPKQGNAATSALTATKKLLHLVTSQLDEYQCYQKLPLDRQK